MNRKLSLVVFVGVICTAVFSPAQQAVRPKEDHLTNFYQEPSEEKFKKTLAFIEENGDKLAAQRSPLSNVLAAFVARVHLKHKFAIEGEDRILVTARAVVAKDTSHAIAKFILDDEKITPSKLDVWWASFFATGDFEFLEKILAQTTAQAKEKYSDPRMAEVIPRVAQWSFKSNCKQHEKVREFTKSSLNNPKLKDQHDFLKSCIDSADAK